MRGVLAEEVHLRRQLSLFVRDIDGRVTKYLGLRTSRCLMSRRDDDRVEQHPSTRSSPHADE